MPTQTFFNLPEAKRKAILDVTIDEFAEHGFKNASISRIVAQAGIAKGSFYQYFADKEDLFLYLVRVAGEEKVKFLSGATPPNPQMGIFPYLEWLIDVGVQFRFAHPKLEQVVYRALMSDSGALGSEHLRQIKEQASGYYKQLVQMGVAKGDIDPSYDPDLVAFVFSVLTAELGLFAIKRLRLDEGSPDREELANRYLAEIRPLYMDLMRLLEHGLRPK